MMAGHRKWNPSRAPNRLEMGRGTLEALAAFAQELPPASSEPPSFRRTGFAWRPLGAAGAVAAALFRRTTVEVQLGRNANGSGGGGLNANFDAVGGAGCERLRMVAMDVWPGYIRSVREHTKVVIAFDETYATQHLGPAVD